MRNDWFIWFIVFSTAILFTFYVVFFPSVSNQDEFMLAQDAIAIKEYAGAALSGDVQHPLAYLHAYQEKTIGLILNVYPPFVSSMIALFYAAFGVSMLAARIVHLLFMIGFLLLFYLMMREEHGSAPARWMVILLIASFHFLKYFGIIYREIPYMFFIFLSIFLLNCYLRTKRRLWLNLFLLSLLLGAMTKDFFLLSLPALLFMLLHHERFRFTKVLARIRAVLRWDSIILALTFVGVTSCYYALKLLTSSKEKEFLLGGFRPLQGVLIYLRMLLSEVPVLLILFTCSLLYLLWRDQGIRPALQKYAVLGASFALFFVSVSIKDLRYAFLFFPLAVMVVIIAAWEFPKPARAVLLSAFLLATLVNSGFSLALHQAHMGTHEAVDDPAVVLLLAEQKASGNILFLSGYRFDISFYLRAQEYNLDHDLIHALFEKRSHGSLRWSRFATFYKERPACEAQMTQYCWEAFVDHIDARIIIVDRTLVEDRVPDVFYDPEIAAFASSLEDPAITTDQSLVFLR